MTTLNYDEWVSEQTEHVASAINRYTMGGIFDETVYCIPAQGSSPGALIVSNKPQTLDVVRFKQHGARVSNVPRSQLRAFIWEACRRLPILPS